MTTRLHLLLPGLLGPLPAEAREWEALRRPLPATARLLGRARRQALPSRGLHDLLRAAFDIGSDSVELPAGALGLLGEGGNPGHSHWLKADPVHLRPDRDRVMLFADVMADLTRAQAQALVADCNRLLRQDALELRLGAQGGWYLRAAGPVELETTPTETVAGRYLDPYLPRGPEAPRWLSLLTELQMLLHTSSANLEREAQGQNAVNSLWIWGGGVLPERVRGEWSRVHTEEPVLRGLALRAGIETAPLPARAPDWQGQGRQLVLLSSLQRALVAGDLQGWATALEDVERDWLAPLLEQVAAGRLELVVEAERLCLTLTPRGLRRFWRRPRPLLRDLEFHVAQAHSA